MTPTTRADLAKDPLFAHLPTDTVGVPCAVMSHYTCQSCTSEQIDWMQLWSCACNDECPNCGTETEPHTTEFLGGTSADDEPEALALWNSLGEPS